jgi:hypothetical protein
VTNDGGIMFELPVLYTTGKDGKGACNTTKYMWFDGACTVPSVCMPLLHYEGKGGVIRIGTITNTDGRCITYNELKKELKQYKKKYSPQCLYMRYIPEDLHVPICEVYPLVCRNARSSNVSGITKYNVCCAWKPFCEHLCRKYDVEFKDIQDDRQRFILHSDGSYEEVT